MTGVRFPKAAAGSAGLAGVFIALVIGPMEIKLAAKVGWYRRAMLRQNSIVPTDAAFRKSDCIQVWESMYISLPKRNTADAIAVAAPCDGGGSDCRLNAATHLLCSPSMPGCANLQPSGVATAAVGAAGDAR